MLDVFENSSGWRQPAPYEGASMEHRWGQRFRTSIKVRVFCEQPYEARCGRVTDISTSGVFIQTNLQVPLLARISVEIPTPTRDGTVTLHVSGCVVRKAARGVGIEWCETAPFAVHELVALPGMRAPARRQVVTPS